jgi:signal transduction histidine kinase
VKVPNQRLLAVNGRDILMLGKAPDTGSTEPARVLFPQVLVPHVAAGLGALGSALAAIAAAVSYSGNDPGSLTAGLTRGAFVLVPIAVGLLIWMRQPLQGRFGALLIAAGLLTFVASLGSSDVTVAYSIGRVAAWIAEGALIYLILAFPSGALRDPLDRLLVRIIAATVLVLFLPTALLTDGYPVPSTWTTCVEHCPANAFQVVRHEPAFVGGLMQPVRELITSAVLLAVMGRLLSRIAHATTPLRRTLTPVLGFAMVHVVALPVAFAVRRQDGGGELLIVLTWVLAAGLSLVALGFLIGNARWRVAIGERLYRLAPRLRSPQDPRSLRALLAETLQDPSVELARRTSGDRWIDTNGRPVELPGPGSGRAHTIVRGGGFSAAAIVHDECLCAQRSFVEAVGSLALMALDNHRLGTQVEASLQEVRRSRRRVLTVADDERRRIERDLHDGAQQRLVALRIKLELASELSAEQHLPDAARLHELSQDVEDALDDVRSLAAGVYPALLVACGLEEALRSAARRSPTPATVAAQGIGRHPQQVEAAVYFSCLEALQNAAKHAEARSVSIVVSDGEDLRFEVRDDGRGFDVAHHNGGHGLTNIRDRLMAVGGSLVVESQPGRGTRLAGVIPHATEP